jgi:pilus assembly protein CpaB
MKPARILLLAVAIIAGGLAAFLATRGSAPAPAAVQVQTQVVAEAKRQVLVARTDIGMGQRLTEELVEWQDWPEGALREEYITSTALPDARQQMVGTVARFEIFAGEPIRPAKLVRTSQGYLSAVIDPGMRAVSVSVTTESGAGGFIVPNDRVDVVQTYRGNSGTSSRTILANIRVLAIGQRLGEVGAPSGNPDPNDPQAQMFVDDTVATLELNPGQSESIIGAAATGELSLVLRSVADFFPQGEEIIPQNAQSIRLIRFGEQSDVTSATPEQSATISPASASATPPPAVVAPLFSSSNSRSSASDNNSGEVPLQ